MITDIIEVSLVINAIIFSLVGGFVVEGNFLALLSLLIVVLCLGFIGIMEAIKEGE